jgi:hypothetical protein
MRVDPEPHEVRRLVVQSFQALGTAIPNLFDLQETVLIDDGKCAARTYRVDGLMAMWLVEVGIVQFYDAEGTMLRTVNLLQRLEPMSAAA